MRLKDLELLADRISPSLYIENGNVSVFLEEWERILQHAREHLAKDFSIGEWHSLSIENVHEYMSSQQRCENFRTYVCEQSKAIRGFLVLANVVPNEVGHFFRGKEDWVIARNFQLFVYGVLAIREGRFDVGNLIRLCEKYVAPLDKYIFPVAVRNLGRPTVVSWLVENFYRCPQDYEQEFRKEIIRNFKGYDMKTAEGILFKLCTKSAFELRSQVLCLFMAGVALMAFLPVYLPEEYEILVFFAIFFGVIPFLRKILSD